MSKFDAQFYREFRPFYPPETFLGLEQKLEERLRERNELGEILIADLGCGTGHSAVSLMRSSQFFQAHARIIAIDPDPGMLLQGERLLKELSISSIELKQGSGEKTDLEDDSVDAILVGSAFHWMNGHQAKEEFKRIFRDKGILRIFEYQFPKALQLPDLNDWIRRQFNLYWKAPDQKPRGTLMQLTEIFKGDSSFRFLGQGQPEMVQQLDSKQLTGLLFSQSRVLHFENTLEPLARTQFRDETRHALESRMPLNESHPFDFRLAWIEFQLTE